MDLDGDAEIETQGTRWVGAGWMWCGFVGVGVGVGNWDQHSGMAVVG